MPMQLSVIRRGDTLNPMVVNVNINMADVKGIKTQFHLRSDDPRRGKHIIPVQQIVKLNTVITIDERRFSRRTGKSQHPKHIIIANASVFSWPSKIQSTLPCLTRALPQCLVLGVDGFGHLSSRFTGLGVSL